MLHDNRRYLKMVELQNQQHHPGATVRMVKPDVIMLNAAIGACERATEWQEALGLLDGSQQVFPDIVTYNTLMSALILGGSWRLKDLKGRLGGSNSGLAPEIYRTGTSAPQKKNIGTFR